MPATAPLARREPTLAISPRTATLPDLVIRIGQIIILALVAALSPSHAQNVVEKQALADVAAYQNGVAALGDHLPDIAAKRFATALEADLSEADAQTVRLKLAEAYVRANKAQPALDALAPLPASPQQLFWKANSTALLGRYAEAVELFRELIAAAKDDDADLVERARLTAASLLISLQQSDEAQEMLAPLLEQTSPGAAHLLAAEIFIAEENYNAALSLFPGDLADLPPRDAADFLYTRARIALLRKEYEQAREILTPLVAAAPPVLDRRLALGATIGLAEAEIEFGSNTEALARLTRFIEEHPNGPFLDQAFALLLRIALDTPSVDRTIIEQLQLWSPAPSSTFIPTDSIGLALTFYPTPAPSERSTFSLYTLSRILRDLEGQEATALHHLTRLRLENPAHYLARLSLVSTAYLLDRTGQREASLNVLASARQLAVSPRLKSIAGFLEAELSAASAESKGDIARSFAEVAAIADNDIAEAAAFNAGLYALDAEESGLVAQMQERLQSQEMQQTLALEIALARRFQNGADSRAALEAFIASTPEHPRIDEAHLALAELAVTTRPIDTDLAKSELDALNPGQVNPTRLALLRIAIARQTGDSDAAAEIARVFLEANADAEEADRVRLALGQARFQEGDYYDAWKALEELANREGVDPVIGETALFIAGVSASRGATDPARESSIAIFRRVVGLGGSLINEARYELASQLLFFGRFEEAFAVVDDLLGSVEKNSPLYLQTITLAAAARLQLAASDSTQLDAALALYDLGLAVESLSSLQRDRLAFLKGSALETSGKAAEAQEVYYSVINREISPDSGGTTFRWFEKAGFRLISLLEADGKYRAAIAVARKVEQAKGPLATEAGERASKIALEQMLFDQ